MPQWHENAAYFIPIRAQRAENRSENITLFQSSTVLANRRCLFTQRIPLRSHNTCAIIFRRAAGFDIGGGTWSPRAFRNESLLLRRIFDLRDAAVLDQCFDLNSPRGFSLRLIMTSRPSLLTTCVSERIISGGIFDLRDAAKQRQCQNERIERGGPQDDELGKQRVRIWHVTHEMDQHQPQADW